MLNRKTFHGQLTAKNLVFHPLSHATRPSLPLPRPAGGSCPLLPRRTPRDHLSRLSAFAIPRRARGAPQPVCVGGPARVGAPPLPTPARRSLRARRRTPLPRGPSDGPAGQARFPQGGGGQGREGRSAPAAPANGGGRFVAALLRAGRAGQ